MSISSIIVPFEHDAKTNCLTMLSYPKTYYPSAYSAHLTSIQKPNYIFKDSLQIIDYYKGRSAVGVLLRSTTDGTKYSMSIKPFMDMISKCSITQGITDLHEWSFIKRGSNYSLVLIK